MEAAGEPLPLAKQVLAKQVLAHILVARAKPAQLGREPGREPEPEPEPEPELEPEPEPAPEVPSNRRLRRTALGLGSPSGGALAGSRGGDAG